MALAQGVAKQADEPGPFCGRCVVVGELSLLGCLIPITVYIVLYIYIYYIELYIYIYIISTCIHVELEIRLQVGQQSQSGKTLAFLRHCFSVTPGWTSVFSISCQPLDFCDKD